MLAAVAALAALFLASSVSAGVVELQVVPRGRLLAAVNKVVEFPDAATQPTAAQSQLLSAENNGTALVQQTVSTHALQPSKPCAMHAMHCKITHSFLVHHSLHHDHIPVCLSAFTTHKAIRSRARAAQRCIIARRAASA